MGDGVVEVRIDRASVAMGDDVATHREVWTYPDAATVDDLLLDIATSYTPGVSGAAGWSVTVNDHAAPRRLVLGLIYHRLLGQDTACRIDRSGALLTAIAGTTGLEVYVDYLTWERASPIAVRELRQERSPHLAPRTRIRLADSPEERNRWQTIRALRELDAELTPWRRAWVRDAVLDTARLSGVEEFVAAHLELLCQRQCPASMALAVDLFGAPAGDSKYRARGSDLVDVLGNPRAATLAMVLAAFEWTLTQKSWEDTVDPGVVAYLEQLERWGYRLSPVEEAYAGRRSATDIIDEARRRS